MADELLNNEVVPLSECGSEALVAVRDGEVALQTSIVGWTSLINYDKVESMSVKTFMEKRLPEFTKDSNNFAVFRDTPTNSIGTIYKDFAAVFHATSVEDIDPAALNDVLCREKEITLIPNTGMYKLIFYSKKEDGDTCITVEIPEALFCFHHASYTEWESRPIWHPRLWLHMRLTSARVLRGAFLAVVKEDAPESKDVALGRFLLPNCGHGGAICFGSTTAEVSGTTIGALAYSVYHQYIDSTFNNDLYDAGSARNATAGLLPQDKSDSMEQLLTCLEDRSIMEKIRWPATSNSQFLWGVDGE